MDLLVHNFEGEVISKVRVEDSVFKIEPNADVVYRAVMSEMTNSRQGTHSWRREKAVETKGSRCCSCRVYPFSDLERWRRNSRSQTEGL